LRAELTKLFKRVFFAGEHIADWGSSVQGAVVAGKAAAALLGIDPEDEKFADWVPREPSATIHNRSGRR
jgi:hypothetical protein